MRFSERDGWVLGLVGGAVRDQRRSARSCDRSKSSHWGWLRDRWCPGGLGGEQATDSYRARRSVQEAKNPGSIDIRPSPAYGFCWSVSFGSASGNAHAQSPERRVTARGDQINNTKDARSLNQETRPREICVMTTVQVIAGQSQVSRRSVWTQSSLIRRALRSGELRGALGSGSSGALQAGSGPVQARMPSCTPDPSSTAEHRTLKTESQHITRRARSGNCAGRAPAVKSPTAASLASTSDRRLSATRAPGHTKPAAHRQTNLRNKIATRKSGGRRRSAHGGDPSTRL